MQKWIVGFVVFLVSGCGAFGPSFELPLAVTHFESFSDSDKAAMMENISYLNKQAGQDVLTVDENSNRFPVKFSVVDAPSDNPNRAGLTVKSGGDCDIQFTKFIFTDDKKDYQLSVFLHEVGHCLGLGHNDRKGSIMYPTTTKFSSYTQDELNQFFKDALEASKKN
jgi:hypothetical protein